MSNTSIGQKCAQEDSPTEEERPARRVRSDNHSMGPENNPVIDDEDDNDNELPFWDLEETVSHHPVTLVQEDTKCSYCSGG